MLNEIKSGNILPNTDLIPNPLKSLELEIMVPLDDWIAYYITEEDVDNAL